MKKTSLFACFIMATLVSMISLTAPAMEAQADALPVFANTTFIEADGIVTGMATIPNDTVIDLNPDPDDSRHAVDVKIDGNDDGLVAMSILAPDELSGINMVRLPQVAGGLSRIAALGPMCFKCPLEAGEYDIVIATTTPVTLTLTLPNLPDPPKDEDGKPIPPVVELTRTLHGTVFDEPNVTTVHADGGVLGGAAHHGAGWRGTTQVGSGRGAPQAFYAFWYSGVPRDAAPADELLLQGGVTSGCRYNNPPPSETLFQPGCPGGDAPGKQVIAFQGHEVAGMAFGWQSGVLWDELAQGGVATLPGVRQVGAAGYWFELP